MNYHMLQDYSSFFSNSHCLPDCQDLHNHIQNLVAVEIVNPSGGSKTRLVCSLITALNITRSRAEPCKKAGCTSFASVLAPHIPNITIRHNRTDEKAALDVLMAMGVSIRS
jgi:hypothetical protein